MIISKDITMVNISLFFTTGVSLTEDTAANHRQPSAAGVASVRALQPISNAQ